MRKIYTLFAATVTTTSLMAQLVRITPGEDTTKAKELEQVIVTGQYKPQSAKNSVYQVRTISKERIQKQGATKLQDVLNNELNIRFSQDLSTGGSGITMMGLKGQNVKVLVDGVPMIGRQGATNEIDINQVDINSIERIEIVEGPMSVVYGADALAGVINIITKKNSVSKISVRARFQEETIGKEYGIQQGIHTQSVGITFRHKRWEIGGGAGYNYFGGWRGDSVGREMTWHWKDQIIANGVIGYNTEKFNIRYRIDGLDEIITNPGNFRQKQNEANDSIAYDAEYLSRRVMQQLQASYFVNSNLSFTAQTSYSDYSRQVFSTILSQNTGKFSLNPDHSKQTIVNFNGFTFRGTAQYKISSIISVQPGVDINLESGKGERLKEGQNSVNDYAFFATAEITPNSKINIRPGLRVIKNSVYDAPPVIPSINTKFVLTKNLDLRLSYARGFRSPSLRELYFNFFDANHQIIGNPDLKAETSHSYNGSLNWKKTTLKEVSYNIALGGFYNNVKNLIDFAFSASSDTAKVANISNSKTAGTNLLASIKYKQWNLSAGASYTGFYNDLSETDEALPQLQWSAEANSTISYSFSKIGLDVNLFYKFTGRRPGYVLNSSQVITQSRINSYQIADFTINKKLFKYLSLSAGVRNLFDVVNVTGTVVTSGIHTPSSTRNIGCGRSYFAGIAFNWDKK
jgi:outer membrane receptor for ferrienterochelin and colicins